MALSDMIGLQQRGLAYEDNLRRMQAAQRGLDNIEHPSYNNALYDVIQNDNDARAAIAQMGSDWPAFFQGLREIGAQKMRFQQAQRGLF